MNKTILFSSAALLLFAVSFNSCEQKQATAGVTQPVSNDSLIKRGAYLVKIAGCDDCHSPKIMGEHGPEIDQELRFSGFPASRQLPPVSNDAVKAGWALFAPDITAAVGPWGTSYAANITSDETGIGNWTEEQFRKAFTQGKWKGMDGNRMLLPPMPWQNFANMQDEDVRAIFAFLKSTKPVKNVVPAAAPPAQQ